MKFFSDIINLSPKKWYNADRPPLGPKLRNLKRRFWFWFDGQTIEMEDRAIEVVDLARLGGNALRAAAIVIGLELVIVGGDKLTAICWALTAWAQQAQMRIG